MKISHEVLVAVVISFAFSLAGPMAAFAATTPSLGSAETYGILSSTYTNTTAGTTINGDIGFTTGPAVAPAGVHANYGSVAPYAVAGTNQSSVLANLNGQACTFTFSPGAIDLSTDTTHGPIGVYTPGVYCTAASSAASIGTGGITLNGSGTYIFRINGALTSVANSTVTLSGGASACDVFWTPTAATTLGANSTFAGTDIDASGITIGSNVMWTGRALAFGGTVTTDTDTITVPTCALATPTPTPTPAPTPSATSTPTPTPSATPTPSSAPTSTPAPGATPTPAPAPLLPNTGIGPDDKSGTPWNIILPIGIFIFLFSLYIARKKRII
ncbi:MAG: ice-binding family protein [Candidatus Paceibacterota bacterium]